MADRNLFADHSDWGCDIHGRDAAQRGVTRRGFMKGGALALVGTSRIPAFLSRSVLAEVTTAGAKQEKLVILFQRGAVDGLNVVVPYKEKNLLLYATFDCDPGEGGSRPGWILRTAPFDGFVQAAL